MYIIDFKKSTIKKCTTQEVADFCNNLIDTQSKDFLGKRYLFIATKAQAVHVINKYLGDK